MARRRPLRTLRQSGARSNQRVPVFVPGDMPKSAHGAYGYYLPGSEWNLEMPELQVMTVLEPRLARPSGVPDPSAEMAAKGIERFNDRPVVAVRKREQRI